MEHLNSWINDFDQKKGPHAQALTNLKIIQFLSDDPAHEHREHGHELFLLESLDAYQ